MYLKNVVENVFIIKVLYNWIVNSIVSYMNTSISLTLNDYLSVARRMDGRLFVNNNSCEKQTNIKGVISLKAFMLLRNNEQYSLVWMKSRYHIFDETLT